MKVCRRVPRSAEPLTVLAGTASARAGRPQKRRILGLGGHRLGVNQETRTHKARVNIIALSMANPKSKDGVRREPLGMEGEVDCFEKLSGVKEFKRGWVMRSSKTGSPLSVLLLSAQRDVSGNRQRKIWSRCEVPADLSGVERPQSFGFQLPQDCFLSQPTASGNKILLARKPSQESLNKASVLWELCALDGTVLKSILVPKTTHGQVYPEGYISRGVEFSPDGRTCAYVAEVPAARGTPHWGYGLEANSARAGAEAEVEGKGTTPGLGTWTGHGDHEDDWGELFVSRRRAAIYLLDLEGGRVAKVEPQLMRDSDEDDEEMEDVDAVTCGKPSFSPDGKLVCFTSWPHVQKGWRDQDGNLCCAKKLGLVYCYNRESYLQLARCEDVWSSLDRSGEVEVVPRPAAYFFLTGLRSSHSGVFHPDTVGPKDGLVVYKIVFLSHESAYNSGCHNACAELYTKSFAADEQGRLNHHRHDGLGCECVTSYDSLRVVGVVDRAETKEDFQGIFSADILPGAVFSDEVYLQTQHRCAAAIAAVKLDTGACRLVTRSQDRSHFLIGAGQGKLVVATSAPGSPPKAKLYATAGGMWREVAGQSPSFEASVPEGGCSVTVREHEGNFDSILIRPAGAAAGAAKDAVILIPHGGPHSAHSSQWVLYQEFLVSLGYSLLLVNYRGSVGYGNEALLSLPGRVGDQDVRDCVEALDACLEAEDGLGRACVMGGSHGGFLTLHLLGQHRSKFECGVVRNPVTSIAGMVSATDIPEWCYCEALGAGTRPRCFGPTAEDLDRMLRCSPIAHASEVEAPTLWLLGQEDRRVRPLAAMDYIAALKAKGLPLKTIVFPKDSHPLSSPQTEFESFINVAWWLGRHLGKQK